MNNWVKSSFSDFIEIQRGHDLPKKKRKEGNIPVIGSNGIVGYHNQSKGLIPGVTIGRSGSIGNVFIFNKPYFPLNTTLYVTDFKGNDENFVYYFLQNFNFSTFDSGSVQPSLNRNYIYTASICYPKLKEQKKIVNFLSSLDEKIEINKKENQTLEKISESLFKSWFINFDPVKFKSDEKYEDLNKGINHFFPDSFEDSELGLMPKGWEIKKIGDLLEFIYGKALPSNQRKEGCIPVYGSNGVVGFHDSFNSKGPGIVVGRAGNPGTVHWAFEDFFVIDSAFSIKVKEDHENNFYYYLLKHIKLELLNTGSAIPGLNRNHAYERKFIFPSNKNLINQFNNCTSNIFKKIHNNNKENIILIKIKNLLSAKLISGELKIIDTQKLNKEESF